MTRQSPPRLPAWLALGLLDGEDAERLLGDLDEEYADLLDSGRGRAASDLWYWRQVLLSVWVLRRERLGRSVGTIGEEGGGMGLRGWAQDLRFAGRQLLRARTFTLTSALTLALGIGATTAIFSVVNAVLLRSLPYDQPEQIARAWAQEDEGAVTDFSFRVVEYQALRERTDVFAHVGAEFPVSLTVLLPGQEARQVQGRRVSSDFFRVFGVEPAVGRMFRLDEVAAGDRPLLVVSHGFWRRFLGADPGWIGRTLDLGGVPFELVGVLPADYRHVSGTDAEVFIPYTLGTSSWIAHWLDIYVRMQPDVSTARAAEEVTATMAAIGETDPRSAGWHATVESLHDMVVGEIRPVVWSVLAMVALVLLVSCVNVANLTLARSTMRLRELRVRRALGAGRGRLLRQLLVESLSLSAVGGLLGLGVAAVALEALVRLAPPSIPRIGETGLDPAVLLFALGTTVATALFFGLVPSLRATSDHGTSAQQLRDRGGTSGRGLSRALNSMVVAEIALSVTLLVGAGLMVRTFQVVQDEELGFDRGGALTFRISVPAARYGSAAEVDRFYTGLREELGALPGVTSVGAGTDLPVSGQGAVASVNSEERVRAGVEEVVTTLQRRATAGLFEALGTPVLEGRSFGPEDRSDGELVTVISESLSHALFGDRSAVGQRIGFGRSAGDDAWMTVVGVVADVRYEEIEAAPQPQVYQAHPQSTARDMAVVVRTTGDPMALMEPVRRVLTSMDSTVPIYAVSTLGGVVDSALAGRRFTMVLFTLFALVALVLTMAGVYGVLAFAVGQRRREIGLRIALGARTFDVFDLVLRRGATLVGAGLALGALGAVGAGVLLRGLLYGVGAVDPATYVAVSLLICLVGGAAALLPARSAARLDPLSALRDE